MRSQHFFQRNIFLSIIIALLGFFAWFSYHRIRARIDSSNQVRVINPVIPENAKDDAVSAKYNDGILQIEIPKAKKESRASKGIEIE